MGPGGSGEVCWDMARSGGVWLGLALSGRGSGRGLEGSGRVWRGLVEGLVGNASPPRRRRRRRELSLGSRRRFMAMRVLCGSQRIEAWFTAKVHGEGSRRAVWWCMVGSGGLW